MTDRLCPVCWSALETDWIAAASFGEPTPTHLPGRQECPNRCDPKVARLLTHLDGPVWNPATGYCVSLGLGEEIKKITGDPDATLASVMNDPNLIWRNEALRRIRAVADYLDDLRGSTM